MRLQGLPHSALHIVLTRVAAEEDVYRECPTRDLEGVEGRRGGGEKRRGGGEGRRGGRRSFCAKYNYCVVYRHTYFVV